MAESPPSRKPRPAAEGAADALASLPLEVLDNILSRLHIYDVVRTSVLSRPWRRRWESLPTVDLSRSHGISASDVDALLLRRSAPVRAFRLATRDASWQEAAFHDWLIHLSRRGGVRDLCLRFPHPPGTVRLHSSVFSFCELTALSLVNCCIRPPPPGVAGLLNLKTLRLLQVTVAPSTNQEHAERALEALIAASPLLEEVVLCKVCLPGDCPDSDWAIQAPNLRRLKIASGFDYGGRTENLPQLEEAVLSGPNYAKFLIGMAGVSKLEFYCDFILPTEVDVLEQLPFLFGNLRSLVIGADFCKTSHISSIFCLLRSAPVLEELDVWARSNGTQEIEANNEFLNAQTVNQMFTKLHIVRMKDIKYHTNEMHFMKFVLLKAKALQLLSISLCAPCNNMEPANEVKEYPRASPDARVIFMGGHQKDANNMTVGDVKAKEENIFLSRDQSPWCGESISTNNFDEAMQTQEAHAHPRRRHRLNSESVAQVEQLQEELLKLKNVRKQYLERFGCENEMLAKRAKDSCEFREYVESAIQLMHENCNMKFSEIG